MTTRRIIALETEKWRPQWPSENLAEFVEWATKQLAAIPEPFRASAEIEFTASDSDLSLEIAYRRPFTPEELEGVADRARRMAAETEAKERAEFDRLALKFGRGV